MTFDRTSRRHAMTALAGIAGTALLTARALAQAAATTSAAGIAAPTMGSAGPTGATIGLTQWRTLTLMAGTYSKLTSELAQSRGSHPKVKQFGMFEAGEQTAVAQTLTDKANPPPAPLDAAHQGKLAALQAMPPGKGFDVAYVAGQIEGHHELEQIQQSYLNSAPTERDGRHMAMLARWSIQQHLTMLGDVQTLLAST